MAIGEVRPLVTLLLGHALPLSNALPLVSGPLLGVSMPEIRGWVDGLRYAL